MNEKHVKGMSNWIIFFNGFIMDNHFTDTPMTFY